MRTITLELLRHGPAHNQLLSPLTPYLALCENHGAVTLHVPFEHNQFLHRLRALGYQIGDEARIFQLQDTARVMGEILSAIPGLTAEANKSDGADEPLTHLRLIISASELALLPFELALSSNGLPGAGQYLLLQPQMPVCLTRETRRVADEFWQWPKAPRILFAAASPPEIGTIPLESHLLALRRLVGPWVKYYDDSKPEERRRRVEDHLYFLPAASIESIEKACADGEFTHVHILAHGVERPEGYDTRFFLALHDSRDPEQVEYISGPRLATALRAARKPDSRGLARPAVVTLASCNSGSLGSVAGAGASIAHALHESGLPMVIAGQFPLSFEGSIRLVECVYEGLLWGADPRRLLYDLRRRLYTDFQERHDWACLTAYVSLPPDFEPQLSSAQIEQAMRSINAAMNHADEVTRRAFDRIRSKRTPEENQPASAEENKALLDNVLEKIAGSKKRLQRLVDCLPAQRSQIYGLLASTEKRHAEVLFSVGKRNDLFSGATQDSRFNESYLLLERSRNHYWQAFQLDRSNSWAVVQYLSLTLVLRNITLRPDLAPLQDLEDQNRPEKNLAALWSMAYLLSLYDLHGKDRGLTIWARGNLIELLMLSLVMPPGAGRPDPVDAGRRALEHADALIDVAGRDSFDVYSTRRQIVRYLEWFNEVAPNFLAPLNGLAEGIFNKFPGEIEEKWK